MSETMRDQLRGRLVAQYSMLRRQLEFIVGSKDRAADALQETWVKLGAIKEMPVNNADAYLLRVASNVAIDQHRREMHHHLVDADVDELVEIEDEAADPLRVVSARIEIEELQATLAKLSPRRQAIFLAATVEGQLIRDIAARFDISVSMVEKELRYAMRECRRRLQIAEPNREPKCRGKNCD
jgi:RNA polymerase sigma factor (sigma-70 family)